MAGVVFRLNIVYSALDWTAYACGVLSAAGKPFKLSNRAATGTVVHIS